MSRYRFGFGRLLVSCQHRICSEQPSNNNHNSQGGQLVHNSAAMLSAADTAFVSSSVIFGDPNNGKPVGSVAAANTKIICAPGDLICAGQAVILPPHLSYGANAGQAANFVVGQMATAAAAKRELVGLAPERTTKAKFYVS